MVIFASPNTVAHSLKLKLVAMMTLVRSQSLLSRSVAQQADPACLAARVSCTKARQHPTADIYERYYGKDRRAWQSPGSKGDFGNVSAG